jgi:sigma-B regulation protein RsbU (phosphoserine phosphatase)
MFVTLFCGILDVRTGLLEYSNGGHNPPYRLNHQGAVEPLETPGGMAIGVIEEAMYQTGRLPLQPGEGLLLYTDGVTEAVNENEEFFSTVRLRGFLETVPNACPKDMIRGIVTEVGRFSSGAPQADDITILAVRYHGRLGNS